ncbi:hypothetical protein H072_10453 [Dactylellina haptotyla CBS 200.50]|uniref:Uncharacterized protein n=1 Tax=Dactylellina haptotyla (strain CBS 200.50) TaxID=1284197 RepID=S7ZZ45_DACHA|nr:hypothetical protein H072_10453 [Dactylellina haptotyla CBS 200.50]
MALTVFTRRALPILTIFGASGAYIAFTRMQKVQRRPERLALWETARSGGGF